MYNLFHMSWVAVARHDGQFPSSPWGDPNLARQLPRSWAKNCTNIQSMLVNTCSLTRRRPFDNHLFWHRWTKEQIQQKLQNHHDFRLNDDHVSNLWVSVVLLVHKDVLELRKTPCQALHFLLCSELTDAVWASRQCFVGQQYGCCSRYHLFDFDAKCARVFNGQRAPRLLQLLQ